jgi:hypothetical protein
VKGPQDVTTLPDVLILSSRFDFTCDYVIAALRRRNVEYLRLNSEDLANTALTLDPLERHLNVRIADTQFLFCPTSLRSVLFRRPVFLRDYGDDSRSAQERFAHVQWASLVRNLMVFDYARWYNDPKYTYRAEHKAVQLFEATRVGLRVPETRVTNTPSEAAVTMAATNFVVKGLDTVMAREAGDEMFGFTTSVLKADLADPTWASAPTILQQAVLEKTDIRVTVVEGRVFAVAILVRGRGVDDDWRIHKSESRFVPHALPGEIADKCTRLVSSLGLRFAAIDLVLSSDDYYFLEINPTGEWAWLVDAAGLPIDEAMADALAR